MAVRRNCALSQESESKNHFSYNYVIAFIKLEIQCLQC